MDIKLGSYDSQAPPKITPLGISYFPYGLDDYGPKKVKRAVARMTEAGVQPYIIAEFREWALRLPTELQSWLDAAYQARMDGWRACIGHRLPNGKEITASVLDKITPVSFKIIFHPAPFAVPQGLTVDGCAYNDRIEIVIADLSNDNTWLRKCDALAQWEIGNLIARRFDYFPDPDHEVGNHDPCSS